MRTFRFLLLLLALAALVSCGERTHRPPVGLRPREGGEEIDPPRGGFRAVAGQTLYVPAYSSIWASDHPRDFQLAVTLSIRNVDQNRPLIVTSVRYYDHDGRLIQNYLKKPIRVGPLASVEFLVKEKDTSGGTSASFLVDWLSEEPILAPVVESVMIGTAGTQGISFTSPARVLADRSGPASR